MRFSWSKLSRSPANILANWPRSLCQLEGLAFARQYSAENLLELCHWAGLSAPRTLRQHGISYRAIQRLAVWAAADRHNAAYHQSGHIAHVIVAAGLLAAADGLSQADRDIVIVAALVHDLDHMGRHRPRQPFHMELWSAQIAVAHLSRYGSDARVGVRLTDLLAATSFTADPMRDGILAADPLAAYLVDADLFASLFYGVTHARKLSALIKFEDRDPAPISQILKRFVTIASVHGFHTDAAADLHARLGASRTVLGLDKAPGQGAG